MTSPGSSTILLGTVQMIAFAGRTDTAVVMATQTNGHGNPRRRVSISGIPGVPRLPDVPRLPGGHQRSAEFRLRALDADDAGLADHGRPVTRLGGDDAVALVLHHVVA